MPVLSRLQPKGPESLAFRSLTSLFSRRASARFQDRHDFSQLVTSIRQQYNENAKTIERTWGGGIMGFKSQAAAAKLERALEKERAKKAMM